MRSILRLLVFMFVAGCATAPSTDAERVQTAAEIRKAREEHTVVVDVLVGVDGSVKDARVAQSSGSARIDEAALREVRQSERLTPGTEDGKPIETWGRFAVTFRVDDATN